MNDFTFRTLIETKGQQETHYLQRIDMLAEDVKESRDMIAAFLDAHPEMEEFISGDKENGYTYVPGKIRVAPEELLKSMEPAANGRHISVDGPCEVPPELLAPGYKPCIATDVHTGHPSIGGK